MKTFFPFNILILGLFFLLFISFNNYSDLKNSTDTLKKGNSKNLSKKPIKVLAIGNSFSEDAVEHYLNGLAKSAGYEIVIGNLVKGGASLEQYWENATNDKPIYSYRKIDAQGERNVESDVTVKHAIEDEDWDFISFQQVSYKTGDYDTYEPALPEFYRYVNNRVANPKVKYMFHQIWAYAEDSEHKQFHRYDNNQMTMYKAIVDVVWKAADLIPIDFIIPAGTAIQNGRTSNLGDNFNRDGHHLNTLGQYTAACTWFEKIFNESMLGNTFKPDDLTDREIKIAQLSAHQAIKRPKEVTELKN